MTTSKEIFPHPLSVHNYLLRIRGGEPLYLESGVLDLLHRAPLNVDSYRPAQLYFDDTLDSYASGSEAFMGGISINSSLRINYDPELEEGRSETGVGYKKGEMSTSVLAQSGTVSELFYSADGDLRQGIQNRKEAQFWFPASAFGGKMRLYVQSIYGSKRTDYEYSESSIGTNYFAELAIDGKTYSPYLPNISYWIYTTDEYDYFLLTLNGGTVQATEMELSKPAKRLRNWLLNNDPSEEEARKVEGYLLASTSLGDTVTVATSSDTSPANDHGDAAFYGWHFNMAGNEGQVVALDQGDDDYYYATHMTMTVSLDTSSKDRDEFYWQDESNWSFSASVLEGPTKFVFSLESLMWRYDLLFGGMEKVGYIIDDKPANIDADVPVYVVYDYEKDEWDVVRWMWEDGLDHIGRNVDQANDTSVSSEDGCLYYTEIGISGQARKYGFYVDGSDEARAVAHHATDVTGNSTEVKLGEFLECFGGLEVTFNCFGGSCSIGGDFNFISQICLPIGDMDSVIVGGKIDYEGDVSWLNGMTLGGTPHHQIGWADCEDGVPPDADYSIDWLNTFKPFKNFSFKTRLIEDGVPAGTAEQGGVNATLSNVWVTHWFNGENLLVHEDRAASDDGGYTEVYLTRCLQENPYASVLAEQGGFKKRDFDYGGWSTHFRMGPNGHEWNANTTPARSNVTGDYFLVNMGSGATWLTNSYADIEDKTYISFVGHD